MIPARPDSKKSIRLGAMLRLYRTVRGQTLREDDTIMKCYDCQQEIAGRVVWLAEDYRLEGGEIDGPYAFHATCADQPWPLFEVTEADAYALMAEKQQGSL